MKYNWMKFILKKYGLYLKQNILITNKISPETEEKKTLTFNQKLKK